VFFSLYFETFWPKWLNFFGHFKNVSICDRKTTGWSNNVANSYPSPGALNCRVLRSCLVPQCSYPPHWPHHQRRLANCDWMLASYTSGQPSNPRRHPTCWASSQWSHIVSRMPCHGPGHLLHSTLTRPSSANAQRLKSRHPFVPAAQQLISLSDNSNIRAAHCGRITSGTRSGRTTPQDSAFSSLTPAPIPSEWPSQEEPGSGLTTSAPVSNVSAPACINGVSSSAASECGADKQTVDHVVLQCQHSSP